MNKIQSEITNINLQGASYQETTPNIEPTYVNFFFGQNGSGKSTIAKEIQTGDNVTYRDGKSAEDYLSLVYNEEFIEENFKSYRGMNGVFTLNSKNSEVQTQINDLNKKREEIRKDLVADRTEKDKKEKEREKLEKDFYKECWDRCRQYRESFPKTLTGKGKSETFTKEILTHLPSEADEDSLKRLYDSAFSDDAKHYSNFNEISDTSILDNVIGSEILSTSIVNSADTELAKVLRDIGSTEWMRQGHELFSGKTNNKCPYCGENLPHNFEEIVIKSFDTEYQKNLTKLSDFLTAYKTTANVLFNPLQALPSEIYPEIDIKIYNDKLEVLKAAIQENITIITSKVDNPASIVSLNDIQPILEELSIIIKTNNKLISDNNLVVASKPTKQKECVKMIFDLFAFQLKDIITAYHKDSTTLDAEITKLSSKISAAEKDLEEIRKDLVALRKQTVETDSAKDSINRMLIDSGMQGFKLEPKAGVPHVYEVRRPNGEIADNLSEGEKNFIAFLYFYHLVQGSISESGDTREKIVVIDDPVSSMDSSSLFIVSTLVRKLIEICRNNADNRLPTVEGNFIKQIFILTHNAYFHREVTQGYVDKYEYASFYLIRKFDCKSTIRLCDMVNPNEPTERMNYNPVKNSYAALWEEFKELKTAIPLVNVIRRILEYYFLQICGYDGATLKDRILVKGKADGKFQNDDGSFNEQRYQMAAALLSYIGTSSVGSNDGLQFVEDYLNADECRKAFELIFETMEQKQHYDMMIKNN